MAEMAAAVSADDLRPAHAQGSIGVPGDGPWDGIEEGWPPASGFELVRGLVERRVTSGTGVDAGGRHVLVILAREGCFRALFSNHAELL